MPVYFQPVGWRRRRWKSFRRAIKESWNLYREHKGFAEVDALVSLNSDYLGRVPVPIQVHIPNSMISDTEPFNWPRPYCLWVANIKGRKQPEKYIELARRLANTGIDFLMVGQPQDKSYAPLLKSAPPNLHYLGGKRITEVNGMLKKSLFLAHTCHPEGFGNIFIQAWSQGKTVVSLAFDPDGLLVKKGLGFFAGGNMETFTKHAKRLLDDVELSQTMGQTARSYASVHFSPKNNLDRLEEVIENCIL